MVSAGGITNSCFSFIGGSKAGGYSTMLQTETWNGTNVDGSKNLNTGRRIL